MDHPVQRIIDWTAVGAIIATLFEQAPKIAAVLAIVWWLIRIYYEVRTGERKLRRK